MKMPETLRNFIAIDLGASNGRVIVGTLRSGKLQLKTAHRFHHSIIEATGYKRWNWKLISSEIDRGLFKAAELVGEGEIASISCDSWSQDFGLIDERGELVYPPVCYRDSRTEGMPDSFSNIISPSRLFRENGSAISQITTLCQLRAIAVQEPDVFSRPSTLLFIADLIHYRLCGEKITDFTFATASQTRSILANQWNADLLKSLHIPVSIFPPVNDVPTVIGRVRRETAPHPKLAGVPVINGAGHDTTAATIAVHPMRRGTLFMSLGTWAMLGCRVGEKLERKFLDDTSTAVLGLPWGQWGVFKGGIGMWPIQECVREWNEKGQKISYDALDKAACEAKIDVSLDLNVPRFFAPKSMLEEIKLACRESQQQIPENPGEMAKAIMRSLADGFQKSVDKLKSATGMKFEQIHVLSGGSQSACLCRLIAKALEIPVIAGPAEATAIGNILAQAKTLGILKTESEIEAVIEKSFPTKTYEV